MYSFLIDKSSYEIHMMYLNKQFRINSMVNSIPCSFFAQNRNIHSDNLKYLKLHRNGTLVASISDTAGYLKFLYKFC